MYLAEGYGKVLYNPAFLMCTRLESNAAAGTKQTNNTGSVDTVLVNYLEQKSALANKREEIFALVMKMVNDPIYGRVTPSQWGTVRAIAVAQTSYETLDKALFEKQEEHNPSSDDLFSYERIIKNGRDVHDHHPGFLLHGVGQKTWKTEAVKDLRQKLKDVKRQYGEEAVFVFLELLASEMAKKATSKGGR